MLWRGIYQAIHAVFGYFILNETSALPPLLGGDGSFENMHDGLPAWPKPWYFDFYFMSFLGFFIEDGLELLWNNRNQKDFAEMVLHHTAAGALIYFGQLINFGVISLLVIWIHFIADVLIFPGRAFVDFKEHPVPKLVFPPLLFVFPYSRLYALLLVIFQVQKVDMRQFGTGINDPFSQKILVGFLSCLYLLHCFWFYLILKFGCSVLF
jgi:hypothetical protein